MLLVQYQEHFLWKGVPVGWLTQVSTAGARWVQGSCSDLIPLILDLEIVL